MMPDNLSNKINNELEELSRLTDLEKAIIARELCNNGVEVPSGCLRQRIEEIQYLIQKIAEKHREAYFYLCQIRRIRRQRQSELPEKQTNSVERLTRLRRSEANLLLRRQFYMPSYTSAPFRAEPTHDKSLVGTWDEDCFYFQADVFYLSRKITGDAYRISLTGTCLTFYISKPYRIGNWDIYNFKDIKRRPGTIRCNFRKESACVKPGFAAKNVHSGYCHVSTRVKEENLGRFISRLDRKMSDRFLESVS
jgi:hypothetical protein